jgi:hypothetical protein
VTVIFDGKESNQLDHYPSEDNKIDWSTDLKALAAVDETQIINPNRWKLGSLCSKNVECEIDEKQFDSWRD